VKLGEAAGLPIKYWDESFSTVNAENMLINANVSRRKRKKVIDKMAAVFILEEYLQSREVVSSED
jgi:putative pre-16S rRNA nuclease